MGILKNARKQEVSPPRRFVKTSARLLVVAKVGVDAGLSIEIVGPIWISVRGRDDHQFQPINASPISEATTVADL
jgi:hypothetical protein